MSLLSQVIEVSPRRETKSEVLEYYRVEYGGHASRKAAEALHELGIIKNRQGEPVKIESLMRRFSSRHGHSQGEHSAAYRAMGENIKPLMPAGGYHIEGTVWVKFSDGDCEEREVNEDITGKDAQTLLDIAWKDEEDALAQAVVNHYMEEDIEARNPTAVASSECQEPELSVSAIEEE